MFNLICIGDPIIDTHVRIDDSSAECSLIPHGDLKLCFDFGKKIPILQSFQSLGGCPSNVASGATKLGLHTTIISTIGNDTGGHKVLDDLEKNGVDTSYISVDEKAKTRYSIVLNYQNDRTILAYSEKKNYEWPRKMPATDWIYYSGLSEGFEEIHKKMIKYLKDHRTVRFAFNPSSNLLKFNISEVKELITLTDLLIVNLEEAETILNIKFEKEKSVEAMVHELLELGADEVVITDSKNGSWAGNKDSIWKMKAYPVTVIGKTGAGDAFSAGYLSARFYNHDIQHALIWGTANSASIIQHEGSGNGYLDKNSISSFSEKFKFIQPSQV